MSLTSHSALADFPAALITAVEAALDAGVFYDDEFHRFVTARLGGPDCSPVLLREIHLDLGDHATQQAAWGEIKQAPRGVYAVLHYRRPWDGRVFRRAPMSDGRGGLSAHADDSYGPEDSLDPAHVLQRMAGYECYCCRKAVERARELAQDQAALAAHGFTVHQYLRQPMQIGRNRYSSALITAIDPAAGTVRLDLVKRGSSIRYQGTLGAARLAEVLATPPDTPTSLPARKRR